MFYSSSFLRGSAQGAITGDGAVLQHRHGKDGSEAEASERPDHLFPGSPFQFSVSAVAVLVSPLTDRAVGELGGGRKYSSDLWVAFAATGLCEKGKSGSTVEPLSGFEKAMGKGVTGQLRGHGCGSVTTQQRAPSMLRLCALVVGDRGHLAWGKACWCPVNLLKSVNESDRAGQVHAVGALRRAATKVLICCVGHCSQIYSGVRPQQPSLARPRCVSCLGPVTCGSPQCL